MDSVAKRNLNISRLWMLNRACSDYLFLEVWRALLTPEEYLPKKYLNPSLAVSTKKSPMLEGVPSLEKILATRLVPSEVGRELVDFFNLQVTQAIKFEILDRMVKEVRLFPVHLTIYQLYTNRRLENPIQLQLFSTYRHCCHRLQISCLWFPCISASSTGSQ